ncbi:MAG: PorP/SprF family type IX secretion system membrane protein [Chitinophagaceae bacterium]
MKCKIFLILIFLCWYGKGSVFAQIDPHTSQYYVNPLFLNPALTGLQQANIKVSGIHRSQWGNITSPFVTNALNVEVATNKNLNFGASLFSQTAGEGGYQYINASFSINYTGLRFGENGSQQINMALQAGIMNRRFDPTKFTLGDQWNPLTGFNPLNPTADIFNLRSQYIADLGVGLLYFDGNANHKAQPYLGVSVFHINQPEDPLSASIQGGAIPTRLNIMGGVSYQISERSSLVPHFLWMKQGVATELMLGVYHQLQVNELLAFLTGMNYRVKDALIPFVGLQYQQYLLGLSYDVNASSLGKLTGNANSFELTLSITGRRLEKNNNNYFKCPRL